MCVLSYWLGAKLFLFVSHRDVKPDNILLDEQGKSDSIVCVCMRVWDDFPRENKSLFLAVSVNDYFLMVSVRP